MTAIVALAVCTLLGTPQAKTYGKESVRIYVFATETAAGASTDSTPDEALQARVAAVRELKDALRHKAGLSIVEDRAAGRRHHRGHRSRPAGRRRRRIRRREAVAAGQHHHPHARHRRHGADRHQGHGPGNRRPCGEGCRRASAADGSCGIAWTVSTPKDPNASTPERSRARASAARPSGLPRTGRTPRPSRCSRRWRSA